MAANGPGERAAILRTQIERILEEWEARVRQEIDAARTEGRAALRDHLPAFLERLAKSLDPALPQATVEDCAPVSETHGKERAELLKYSVTQVLDEYQILREVLFKTLEIRQTLATDERTIVLRCFDVATREAAEAFTDERTERERQKRRRVEIERDRTKKELTRLEADSNLQKTFVATLTHDLRNPIAAVRSALELLLEVVPSTEEVQDLADIMTRNIENTETMVLDLLDANRIKSGHRLFLDVDACDLSQIAKVQLAELYAVHGRGCGFQAPSSIRGYWCADRLRRLIRNLLDNAIKYGDPDRPIALSIHQDAQKTTISVHNDGNPISPEDQRTIFEPHYQVKQTGNHSVGWGLGLTLVQGVSEAHGGNVRVVSSDATGTTFIVELPNDSRPFQE